MRLLFWGLLLFFSNLSTGQILSKSGMHAAVLIELSSGKLGSGFLYGRDGREFLLTAKHVIYDSNGVLFGNTATILAYSARSDSDAAFILDLQRLQEINKIHVSKTGDIVAIEFAKSTENNSGIVNLEWYVPTITGGDFPNIASTGRELTAGFEEISESQDVFVIGYPKSLQLNRQESYFYDRPLLRKGIVAGKYPINKTIIIDCFINPGNSGGPVIAVDAKGVGKFIGIVVGFIESQKDFAGKLGHDNITRLNSEYSIVESMDKINTLIDDALKN